MHQYWQRTCLFTALTTFIAFAGPRADAQELPAALAPTLPAPPRGGPPIPVDVGGNESPFTYATIGSQSCRLPCRMDLQPGVQPVLASGKRSFISHIEVPPNTTHIDFADVTGAYRTAGAILIPTGFVTAASLWALGLGCRGGCMVANFTVWPVLGISALLTGIGLLGYSAGRDRYQVRVRPGMLSRAPRLTAVAAAPTTAGAAMGAAFVF